MLPDCVKHADRKMEIVCLSNQCDQKFRLICMACLNATKCKRHNWKLVSDFIEEALQVVENEDVKLEKRVSKGEETRNKKLQTVLDKIDKQMDSIKSRVMKDTQDKVDAILNIAKNLKKHQVLKTNIKDFRKTEQRSITNLNSILFKISEDILDDQSGQLKLKQTQNKEEIDDLVEAQIESFSQQTQQLSSNIEYLASANYATNNFDNEKKQLNAQIDSLLEQTKTIPVLKSRIDSLIQKLKAKESRIRQFEDKLDKSKINDERISEMNCLLEKSEKEKTAKAVRMQALLVLRQSLCKAFNNHCEKCPRQQIKIQKFSSSESTPLKINNTFCQASVYLNFAMLNISDELIFLGYREKEEGDAYIATPVIQQKDRQNVYMKRQNPLELFLYQL